MNCSLCKRMNQACVVHRIEAVVRAWQVGIGNHLMLRAGLVRDGVLREEARPS